MPWSDECDLFCCCFFYFSITTKLYSSFWSLIHFRRNAVSLYLHPIRSQHLLLLQFPLRLWSQQRNVPSGPDRPPLTSSSRPPPCPSILVLLAVMMNDSSSQQKELTHHCISAPYFQSGQELNGFTNTSSPHHLLLPSRSAQGYAKGKILLKKVHVDSASLSWFERLYWQSDTIIRCCHVQMNPQLNSQWPVSKVIHDCQSTV